ncbi:hypothetical protein BKA69DRAFT_1052263 [Paraphysoderma sedebokerense]|nr:hypothetical protein BKA69DRAFT_1052263 [Paraphysoderma sedebokerense]
MLFPKPHDFQFYRDSFRFIGVLAIIGMWYLLYIVERSSFLTFSTAGIGFCFSIYNFVQLRVSARTVILRALDLITIIIPPALPATMSVGTSFAISRLRRSEIFCISPSRVIISGKVNIMCFDKTGTLTEEGLDVLGVQCVRHSRGQFDDLRRSVDYLPSEFTSTAGDIPPMLHALAACHSLKTVNEECVGDPLDLKMFEWTGWELEEAGHLSQSHNSTKTGENGSSTQSAPISSSIVPTVVRPPGQSGALKWDALITEMANSENGGSTSGFVELGILKTFDFVSSLRRMTVVVKQLGGSSLEVFTKGAPEVMKEICNPTSMPSNYDSLLTTYAHNGYRVIAVAAKKLVGLSLLKAQKLKRHQVESDLTFLGFIIFENKLKPGTQSAIFTLCAARIRQTMCTGDNVLTAISVARECGMVSQKDVVFVPRFVEGSSAIADAKLLWESVDDQRIQLDPFSFKPLPIFDTAMSREIAPRDVIADYHLAVTGDVFGWMVENAPQDSLRRMLYKGQIFARMSPDQKQELVEKYQDLGYCVGFCGDGANDCGALKAADVGLSLSEAEASVAAPFTSKSVDIHCVLDLIREGRAALVTSFSCFKYMALYSFIQFTTVTLLYTFASNLGDFQFLYIDLYLILPLAVFMGRARAYHSIVPKRPTANLMSKKVLTSLIGQILLQIVFQLVLFFSIRRQPWYQPPSVDVDRKDVDCFENTVLFMLTSFQYIIMAIVFSVGPPYRASMFSNVLFILTTALLIMSSAVVVLAPFNWLGHLLELYDIPSDFRWLILGLCFTNFVASWTCENYLFPFVASMITRLIKVARLWNENQYRPLNDGRKKKKVWKQVAEDMKSW